MQSLLFRQLGQAALDDLRAMILEPFCRQPMASMLENGLEHIPLPDAAIASAVWSFVEKWGTHGQLGKLRRLLLDAGVEPPQLNTVATPKISLREQREMRRTSWFR